MGELGLKCSYMLQSDFCLITDHVYNGDPVRFSGAEEFLSPIATVAIVMS